MFPAIPDVLGKTGSEASFTRSVKETLDVGIGRIGDPLDRFARVRDLVNLGIAEAPTSGSGAAGAGLRPRPVVGPGGGFPGVVPPGSIVRPGIINNIRTRPVWNGIGITFDWPDPPAGGLFQEWAGVEVWGAFWGDSPNGIAMPPTPRPSFQQAQLVGSTATNYFLHDLGPDGFSRVWVYWLRFIYIVRPGLPQQYGPFTPLESQQGVVGISTPNPTALVRALQGRVEESLLALGLRDAIARGDLESAATWNLGSINTRVLAVTENANSGIQQVAALRTGVQGALTGSFGVRVQLGTVPGQPPYVTGFGLIATSRPDPLDPLGPPLTTSDFIVSAATFAVIAPNSPTARAPFIVDAVNGLVGIDGGLVVTGSIIGTSIQAQTIGAREIAAQSLFADFITGNQVVGGTVRTAGDQNWRATMNGIGSQDGGWPFWYGIGAVGGNGTVFGLRFNVAAGVGDVLLNGDMIVGGQARIRSAGGGDARIEVGGNDYLLWAGSGPLSDNNGRFFVRLDGTPVIRGVSVTFPSVARVGDGSSASAPIQVVPPVGAGTATVFMQGVVVCRDPAGNPNVGKSYRITARIGLQVVFEHQFQTRDLDWSVPFAGAADVGGGNVECSVECSSVVGSVGFGPIYIHAFQTSAVFG